MENNINSKALASQINLFLDDELNQEDKHRFLSNIQGNNSFSNMLDNERSFRSFVRKSIQKSKVSPKLIQNIKSKISVSY